MRVRMTAAEFCGLEVRVSGRWCGRVRVGDWFTGGVVVVAVIIGRTCCVECQRVRVASLHGWTVSRGAPRSRTVVVAIFVGSVTLVVVCM